MRKKPKNAPILVTMILLPYVLIRTAMDLVMWLTDEACEIFQVLEPRIQGAVIGFFGAIMMFICIASMAVWG